MTRLARDLGLVFLAVWCAANWLVTIRCLQRFYVVIPVMDYWRVVYWLREIRAFNPHFLWVQHNEHRIVVPDLVFAADVLLMHGRRVLPVIASFGCYFGFWLLLSWLWLREKRISRISVLGAVLLAGILIGWKGGALALADPFLIQWNLLSLAALASLAALTSASGRHAASALIASVVLAAIATYSSGNGMLLWPVLWGMGIWLRLAKREMLILVVAGVLAVGAYFIGYQSPRSLHLRLLFAHPLYSFTAVCQFLSMPFGAMKSPQFGGYVGLTNLLAAPCLLGLHFRSRAERPSRAVIICVGWYSFMLLSALLIAAGRMDPSDNDFVAVKALRYLSFTTLNWGVLVSLVVATAAVRRWRMPSTAVCCGALALLLAIAFFKLRFWFEKSGQISAEQQVAELSVENGVLDPALIQALFPDLAFVENLLPVMKTARVSIYYRNAGEVLGTQLPPRMRDAIEIPSTQITRSSALAGGTEIIGWARQISGHEVLLVNEANRIVGTGGRPANHLPWTMVPPDTPPALAWVAFVPAQLAHGAFRAYLAPFPFRLDSNSAAR